MNEELLDSMLVKPLPKKYDKTKNTFLFAETKSDEELQILKLQMKEISFQKSNIMIL